MTYDPRTYWEWRANLTGPSYVGPGGHEDLAREEGDAFRDLLRDVIEPCHILLDFGCGSGRMSDYLARYCAAYVGVDISSAGLLHAKTRHPSLTFAHLDGDTLPMPRDSVDCVVATVVFQHIPDDDFVKWCAEIARALHPNGRLVVIDSGPMEDPHPHMFPRTWGDIAKATGLTLRDYKPAGQHWLGVFT